MKVPLTEKMLAALDIKVKGGLDVDLGNVVAMDNDNGSTTIGCFDPFVWTPTKDRKKRDIPESERKEVVSARARTIMIGGFECYAELKIRRVPAAQSKALPSTSKVRTL